MMALDLPLVILANIHENDSNDNNNGELKC